MQRKHLPYFFLAFLSAVLLFILGVRYGQGVERINRAFASMMKLTPSPVPTHPEVTPTTAVKIYRGAFFTYTHPKCGVSFQVPTQLEEINEGSSSAFFSTAEKKHILELTCEKNILIQEKDEKAVTVNSLHIFESTTENGVKYRLFNPSNGFVLTVSASREYLPSLQNSLTLVK